MRTITPKAETQGDPLLTRRSLVSGLKRDDPKYLDRFYAQYRSYLTEYVVRTNPAIDADEVASKVLFNVYKMARAQKLEKREKEGAFRNLLKKLCNRRSKDVARAAKSSRHNVPLLNEEGDDAQALVDASIKYFCEHESDEANVLKALLNSMADINAEAVKRFGRTRRVSQANIRILLAVADSDLSNADLARRCGCTVTTIENVKKRLLPQFEAVRRTLARELWAQGKI